MGSVVRWEETCNINVFPSEKISMRLANLEEARNDEEHYIRKFACMMENMSNSNYLFIV